MKYLGQKHDVILIHINDKRETTLPNLGIIPIHDKESGKTQWINSSSTAFGNILSKQLSEGKEDLQVLSKKHNISYLHLSF